MVFWHPKGWKLYQTVEQYMRQKQLDNGYQEVKTPQIVDRVLWENLVTGVSIMKTCLLLIQKTATTL